jgi:hypothetical protein
VEERVSSTSPLPDDLAEAGPFARVAHVLAGCGLAVMPVGGADGKEPLVTWGRWKRPPGHSAIDKFIRQFPGADIGVICHLSNITVVDVDDPALVGAMLAQCGDTPLRLSTPRGGVHLVYRHGGEQSAVRLDGMAVDVKAVGGFVLVPPSVRRAGPHAGKCYDFICGSWDDLPHLPKVKTGSLPLAVQAGKDDAPAGQSLHLLQAVGEGRRNTTLFKTLLRVARHCDDVDALVDVAEGLNEACLPPLPASELVRVAQSAWSYEETGKNWAGKGARVVVTAGHLEILATNVDALALCLLLRMNHGARAEPFAVSPKAMAEANLIPGWGPKRYSAARAWLVAQGFLVVVHEGGTGPGDAWLYRFP